jgi:acetyl-CoA carboxylase carboxyltransferase component
LSGLVPRIAIVNGRCFAGNAVIAACADLIVATEDVSIGMGGPAMIAGGGLGDVDADDVGPISMQAPNGVVDVVVVDEAEAVAVTKRLLSYFQGATAPGRAHDQTRLRTMVPERARRAYHVTPIIETLADDGSVTFLRDRFAPEMVTALARIEGRAVGIIANNTMVMAGAITAAAADKAARFLQLCDAFGLPVVSLVDCPGYMVGPAAESEALVRRASRMLVAGAALRVPLVAVVLRRGYGLGAQAMVGGSLHEPLLTVAWPGAHLGPMGLEGAVRLGLRKELDKIADDGARGTDPAGDRRCGGECQGAQRRCTVRDRRRHRSRRYALPDRRDIDGRRVARTAVAGPAVRGHLVEESWDGAAIAPLGEWSLEATILDGARGM